MAYADWSFCSTYNMFSFYVLSSIVYHTVYRIRLSGEVISMGFSVVAKPFGSLALAKILSGRSYTHILIYPYTHTHTHILIYSYTHILIYSYTHILIYSYTHIFIYPYTHTLRGCLLYRWSSRIRTRARPLEVPAAQHYGARQAQRQGGAECVILHLLNPP
jgi:hypothetical protein